MMGGYGYSNMMGGFGLLGWIIDMLITFAIVYIAVKLALKNNGKKH
ncbi:hypothetical protein [Virgibacillus halodenitrificans]|nr:hypothetical protein [Virgibacillus halodenitrificans]MCJ0931998.1 hypothetical protein [Virgibacillus halodenitrificans]MEC2158678.1 hypothetical protein [Virgibacillus halodenitrificans]WHX24641.1 hypothetical protein QNH47_10595 [Virgibacillus halodenitrificans]